MTGRAGAEQVRDCPVIRTADASTDGSSCMADAPPLPVRIPAVRRPPIALDLNLQSPRRARRHALARAREVGSTEGQADVVALLACELVTNAIRATLAETAPARRIPVKLWVSHSGRNVLIEVDDYAASLPALASVTDGSEAGRGLHLVDALSAHQWGCLLLAGGRKRVWALVPKVAG